RDMQEGTTIWLSKGAAEYLGTSSNGYRIVDYATTPDARVLAYKIANPDASLVWLFRYDVATDSTLLLATNSYLNSTPQLSANGRFLAYESDTNLFIWDDVNQSNVLASVDVTGSHPATGT